MALSDNLIYQFAKLTTDEPKKPSETSVNGTYKNVDGVEFVQIDGSDIWTPVTSTVEAETGERVTVLIKNHTATVTGNITSPSARNKTVQNLKNEVDEQGNTIQQMDNTIVQQGNSIQQMDNNIKQQNDTINSFNNTITQQNNKIQQFDTTIKQQNDSITSMNNTVNSFGNQIDSMNNTITQHDNSIQQMDNTISQQGNVISQQGNVISQQGTKLETFDSDIKILNSAFVIKDGVLTGLSEIVVNDLETNTLNAKYADIDFANINMAAVEKVFADSGIIKDLIVSEGKITGELIGVTIKGDLIEGNTIKADKLVVKGSDGLYYKLNLDSLGEATVSADEKYQNGLDGSVIIANSIVAEKISVDDLVAFDATIGGFKITENSIYSGVKESINNTTRGIYMDNTGQIAFGDSDNFIKYFKDTDGKYKIIMKANSISMGASGKTVEEQINDVDSKVSDFKVGIRNYLSARADSWESGHYSMEAGDKQPNKNRIRLKELTPVLPNTEYIFNTNSVVYKFVIRTYDVDGVFIKSIGAIENNRILKTTTNEYYFGITIYNPSENELSDTLLDYLEDGTIKPQMNKGNKPTDWTPSTEDTDVNIIENKNQAVIESSEIINQNREEINNELTNYVKNENFEEYQGTVSTLYEQTSKEFNFLFDNMDKKIDDVNDSTQSEFQEWKKYIRFVDGNIVLGKVGNEITLHLENNILYFLQNNNRVAYLNNNKLYVTDGEFVNSLQLGKFAFKPRPNGSLSFGKVNDKPKADLAVVDSAIVDTSMVY